MSQEDNLAQLAAAFNDHQITDEDGKLIEGEEETSVAETASDKKTTEEESKTEVKQEETKSDTKPDDVVNNEAEVAEDESGLKYVPEKRFSKIYGKLKQTERELEEIKKQREEGEKILREQSVEQPAKPIPQATALEIEVLRMQLPQFDPTSQQYSKELDSLGAEIFKANKGITRIEAARRAISYAESLTKKQVEAKEEVRQYKTQNSDQGITNRVVSRVATQKKPEDMSLEEMESYLKSSGQW